MKRSRLIIFLTVVFTLYSLLNIYIHSNAIQALAMFGPGWSIMAFNAIFIFLVFSYPVARILGKWLPVAIADFLSFIGGLWFAAMLYAIISLVSLDLIKILLGFIPSLNLILTENIIPLNALAFLLIIVTIISLITYGYFNAISPRVKTLHIPIAKSANGLEKLHVVFASDIHLGHVIGKSSLLRILKKINELNPDLVLFPGDIVDEELKPVMDKNLGELFKSLNPKYGVFAVTGNHEYIGGVEPAVKYLSQFGITFLRDKTVKINQNFYVAGREDVSTVSFYSKKRKTISELLEGTEPNMPVIMMDHQPIALNEAANNGVDLQISGHTHHGQMWPLQAITKRVFLLSWGYKKIKESHFYVSSGAGSWGPRVRIGNHPEIVSLRLNFLPSLKESQS